VPQAGARDAGAREGGADIDRTDKADHDAAEAIAVTFTGIEEPQRGDFRHWASITRACPFVGVHGNAARHG
jgi:hypothetical protein